MQEKENEQSTERFFKYEIRPAANPNYAITHYTVYEENIPKSVAINVQEIRYGAVFGVIDRYTREGKKYKLLRVQKSSQPENIKEKIFSFHGTSVIEVPNSNPSD